MSATPNPTIHFQGKGPVRVDAEYKSFSVMLENKNAGKKNGVVIDAKDEAEARRKAIDYSVMEHRDTTHDNWKVLSVKRGDTSAQIDCALDSMAEQIGSLGANVAGLVKRLDLRGDAMPSIDDFSAKHTGNFNFKVTQKSTGKTWDIPNCKDSEEACRKAQYRARGDAGPSEGAAKRLAKELWADFPTRSFDTHLADMKEEYPEMSETVLRRILQEARQGVGDAENNGTNQKPPSYNAEAVQKEISKDKRIKGKEASAIHRLLKGRHDAEKFQVGDLVVETKRGHQGEVIKVERGGCMVKHSSGATLFYQNNELIRMDSDDDGLAAARATVAANLARLDAEVGRGDAFEDLREKAQKVGGVVPYRQSLKEGDYVDYYDANGDKKYGKVQLIQFLGSGVWVKVDGKRMQAV